MFVHTFKAINQIVILSLDQIGGLPEERDR